MSNSERAGRITKEIAASDARGNLSRLFDLAEAGEEILITRRGKTNARLVSAANTPQMYEVLHRLAAWTTTTTRHQR